MKSKTTEWGKITSAYNEITVLADQVAKNEAAIVVAEQRLESADRDDGVSSAQQIFERRESARRDLGILKIEANRAAAKLSEAEANFEDMVLGAMPLLLNALEALVVEETARITKASAELFGPESIKTGAFAGLLRQSPSIAELQGSANRIRMSHNTGGMSQSLVVNMIAGERAVINASKSVEVA